MTIPDLQPAATNPFEPADVDAHVTAEDESYFDTGDPDKEKKATIHGSSADSDDIKTPGLGMSDLSAPSSPGLLPRSGSFSNMSQASLTYEDAELAQDVPPLDRLTLFDFLENLSLPQRLEKIQSGVSKQAEKMRRQQRKLREQSKQARSRVVDEWRKRIPDPEERYRRYRKSMASSVDRLQRRWNDTRTVSIREKVSFVVSVLNIFISGYIIGNCPQHFYLWYTAQLAYFYPIRYFTYHKRGMHYFLADLCYWVNIMLVASIWVFPNAKRLFIATFCLAFGNNAVAIAMWRNSLVFHSLDKVTSLFIHIMPCVTIHTIVHQLPEDMQRTRFPAIYRILTSAPGDPEHYGLFDMFLWASIPYAIWQIGYHYLISIRRADAIAAGRPTSFTWLRRSYSRTFIGKFVLSWPDKYQELVFMSIQYVYAVLTMVPAPFWFWYRWASVGFLCIVFTWSIYNGANYYIDVFGTRFQKELEKLQKEMASWQMSPEMGPKTPGHVRTPGSGDGGEYFSLGAAMLNQPAAANQSELDAEKRRSYGDRLSPGTNVGAASGYSGVNGSTSQRQGSAQTALEKAMAEWGDD